MTWRFDNDFTQRYTEVRQAFAKQFIADVRKQEELESAADVGCGVGYFSKFLSELGFQVVATDGREENVAEAKRRYPEITFIARNVECEELPHAGVFDFVLCFGLLYHLENPFRAVRNLYSLTGKLLLVETMCTPGDEPRMELLDEAPSEDQGLNYVAFYPTESCLIKMLYRAGFPFVYRFKKLPSDKKFETNLWEKKSRTFLAGSRIELTVPNVELVGEPKQLMFARGNPWETRLSKFGSLWDYDGWTARLFNVRVRAVGWVKGLQRRTDSSSGHNVGTK
jgi:SAM-dependent methyltransferase